MKFMKQYIFLLLGVLLFISCDLHELDNYKGPDATIFGGIYDVETGELVQQDILHGMQIEYVENGFDNPETQYMVVKNDGTFMNKLMFSGTYTIQPVRGNFVPVPKQGIEVKGDTRIDFKVQPYIRIKNLNIKKQDNKVVATFQVQQTISNKVSRLALFAHPEPNVGSSLNTVSSIMITNAIIYPETEYTLEIDLANNASRLKPGEQYYFRVGALMDAPEAKYNYAPAVRLTL